MGASGPSTVKALRTAIGPESHSRAVLCDPMTGSKKDSKDNPMLGVQTFALPPNDRAVVACNSIPEWKGVTVPSRLADKFSAEEFQTLVDELNAAWRAYQWTAVQMIPLCLLIIPAIIVGCHADTKACNAMIAAFESPSTAALLKGKGLSGSAKKVNKWREASPGTWSYVACVEFTIS